MNKQKTAIASESIIAITLQYTFQLIAQFLFKLITMPIIDMNQFIFPTSSQSTQLAIIVSKKQLLTKLGNMWNQAAPYHKNLYRVYINRDKSERMSARCYYCKSHLIYARQQINQWKCIAIDNKHIHKNNIVSTVKLKRSNMKMAQQFMKQLPQNYDLAQIKETVSQKFGISPQNWKQLISRVNLENGGLLQEATNGILKNYDIAVFPELLDGNIPQILIFTNSSMKKLYTTYGDCVWLQIKHPKLKQKPLKKQFTIGLFMGTNNKNKTVVFTAFMTQDIQKKSLKKIIKTFLQMMGKQPESLVTDCDAETILEVQELREEGLLECSHFYDVCRYLMFHRVKAKYRAQLLSLMRSQSQFCYVSTKDQILSKWNGDDEIMGILNQLQQEKQKICSFLVNAFVGIGLQDYKFDAFTKKLFKKLPVGFTIADSLKILVNSIDENNRFDAENQAEHIICKLPASEHLFLQQVYFYVNQKIFEIFYDQAIKAINCDISPDTSNLQIHLITQKQQVYEVMAQKDHIKCSCNFKMATGVPCRHIIKIACMQNINIRKHISQRWLKDPMQFPSIYKQG